MSEPVQKRKKKTPRKVVQIAVAVAGYDDRFEESLYALDSTGAIWMWRDGSSAYTHGWVEIDLPWKHISKKKEPT